VLKTNPLNLVIGVLGLLIMVTGFIFLQAGQAQTQTPTSGPAAVEADLPARTITVSGTGEAAATPDQAVIRLGVRIDADTAAEALTQNSQQMQALIQVFRDAGAQAADIQTQAISIWPRYSESTPQGSQTPELAGYTASNIVEVRVRDLSQLGSLLDEAVQAGGNTIESISFKIGDQAGLLEDARQAAMSNALQKAEQLASLAGAELGVVLTIQETGGTPPVPLARGGVDESIAVPVEPGTQTVSVSVQVTWLLE
jgi:uncharacterized protein YggE